MLTCLGHLYVLFRSHKFTQFTIIIIIVELVWRNSSVWFRVIISSKCVQTVIRHMDLDLLSFFWEGRFHIKPVICHSLKALSSDIVYDF